MKLKTIIYILSAISIALLGVAGYEWQLNQSLQESFEVEKNNLEENLELLKEEVSALQNDLSASQEENTLLTEAYEREKNKNSEFEDQIREIAGTVGTLEKLAKTDPELLQKYSRVYFLNEHYFPSRLTEIDHEYSYNPDKVLEIHAKVWPNLEDLLEEAKEDGVDLEIVSAYRSFGTQASLKSQYDVTYGEGTANQFSADQGFSEHQLGTTVDFTSPEESAPFVSFEGTEAYEWLQDNAHKFGFVLSYPENNSYYIFEPWHWRFVGEDLAEDLHENGNNFYDMDQRKIDEYLVNLFD